MGVIGLFQRLLDVFLVHSRGLFVLTGENARGVLLKSSHVVVVLPKGGTLIHQSLRGELIGRRPVLIEGITAFLVGNIGFVVAGRRPFEGSLILFVGRVDLFLEDILIEHWLIVADNRVSGLLGIEDVNVLVVLLPDGG